MAKTIKYTYKYIGDGDISKFRCGLRCFSYIYICDPTRAELSLDTGYHCWPFGCMEERDVNVT